MTDKFEVKWEVEDGYMGGSRPQYFDIDASEVEGLDEDNLRQLFWDMIQEQFAQTISPYSDQEGPFIEWAKGLQPVDSDD